MTLRSEAIQHMAESLQTPRGLSVEAGLDALLDFLGAHAEEWRLAAGAQIGYPTHNKGTGSALNTSDLVAALRGPTEEP